MADGFQLVGADGLDLDDYTCSVCHSIALDPATFCTKGHMCCVDCITRLRDKAKAENRKATCPICRREDIMPDGEVVVLLLLKKGLENVMMTCTACGEVVRTDEAKKHQKEVCPFKIMACPSGCGWHGYWGLLADHLESECEMLLKPCPFQCGHLIRPCRPDIHNKFCPAQTKTTQKGLTITEIGSVLANLELRARQPAEGGDDPLLILGTLATMRGALDSVQARGGGAMTRVAPAAAAPSNGAKRSQDEDDGDVGGGARYKKSLETDGL